MSEITRVFRSVPVKLHYQPSYLCAAAVIHLSLSDGKRLFHRLEEVLVMGMRMTEGISHKVSYSLKVKVIFRSRSEKKKSKRLCLFSAALGAV